MADRDDRIEQIGQHPQDAGLSLPSEAQEQHVVLREDRVFDLGNDGFVISDDSRKERLSRAQTAEQIGSHLGLHAAGLVTAVAELVQGLRPDSRHAVALSGKSFQAVSVGIIEV